MEPMRVLIVDDEHFAVHSLCLLLSHYPSLVVLPSSGNGVKALEQLHNNDVDIVFIDVLMPGLNGIDVLKQLNKVSALAPPLFVVYTAYEQFAYPAFQYKAFAYLTKPISPRQLQQVLADAYAVLQRKAGQSLQQQHPKLQFHVGSSTVFIEEQEIILLESAGNYVCLRTRHQNIIVRETLKELVTRLPPMFVQVHRSILINILHIKQVINASVSRAVMSDDTEVRLSRRYKLNWEALLR